MNSAPGGFGQVQPTTFFLFSIYWQLQNNAKNFDSDPRWAWNGRRLDRLTAHEH